MVNPNCACPLILGPVNIWRPFDQSSLIGHRDKRLPRPDRRIHAVFNLLRYRIPPDQHAKLANLANKLRLARGFGYNHAPDHRPSKPVVVLSLPRRAINKRHKLGLIVDQNSFNRLIECQPVQHPANLHQVQRIVRLRRGSFLPACDGQHIARPRKRHDFPANPHKARCRVFSANRGRGQRYRCVANRHRVKRLAIRCARIDRLFIVGKV